MKLLIIEDEVDLARMLQKGLQKRGYVVDMAHDGLEGLETACINDYDAIVLDLNLPTLDGLDVLERLRAEKPDSRVLILSARSEIEDRVKGLELGASDYLPKPFDFRELEARIGVLLRREFVQKDTALHGRGIKLMLNEKRAASEAGDLIPLAPREYAILEYMMLHSDRTISAEELIEHVWSSDADYFSASVKVHISSLRRKLRAAVGDEVIQTVRGRGYIIEGVRGR